MKRKSRATASSCIGLLGAYNVFYISMRPNRIVIVSATFKFNPMRSGLQSVMAISYSGVL